ncbi:TonB-dependent siderophore myxochelin receptor MxcH [Polyangium sp. 15x6]|uniref:TonB-dependent siderophore myxochelin receptor MxcH n=1 Tax=Polyangium sp. 15x6 TaxID=3042687 RepID=UPI00249A2815|nr:TonB-dependent siderophore myxochelin receptor MxcH [Polyangium sp. 15x6]MDI3287158.1 TonB-dependent siderophore myxochelin receptor MxcH [Polyangium sp. 15x6]
MFRKRRFSCTGWAGSLALVLSVCPTALAQEAEPSGPSPAQASATTERTVHPPELIEAVEAAYPAEARAARREGRVVLKLRIDAAGRVTRAEVVEPAGNGFDEAAQEAALQFRFTPARRGDKAVPVIILYAYEFRLPPEPPPAPEARPAPAPAAREPGPEPAAPAAQTTVGPAKPSIDVMVRGASEADRLRRSAQAVQVIETEDAQRRTADLGEVLARSEGVGVRREGGLGSNARLSLNGLTGDQIRFFLDGVPLDLAGYAHGITNVPVNLVERIEVYRGVVPVRFGADALGGAVNLVTDADIRGTHASASYQVGSFKTYRLTLSARHLHEPTGFFARVNGFYDYTRNDYPIDVEVFDEQGRLSPARVHRFHDGYRAGGGSVEVGFVGRPRAEKLLLRAFYTEHRRDVQHNALMSVPYGEVTYGKQSAGAHLRYAQPFSRRTRFDAVAGYTYTHREFQDLSTCRYDWFGRCVFVLPQRGEIEARAIDQAIEQHNVFARLNLAWNPAPWHSLRFGLSPTYAIRTGKDHAIPADEYDPLTAQRALLSTVVGAEYEARPFAGKLANIAFAKAYVQMARTKEQLPNGNLRDLDRTTHRGGIGDSLRFRFTEAFYAKASYEYATRLPNPEEVFGNGALIIENLHLEPEASHNVNLGLTLERAETAAGLFRFNVNGFGRFAENLIVLLSNGNYFQHENVLSARSVGVEASLGWTSPGDWVALDGYATWQDFRNTASEGAFGKFEGDRIPNRPYLFAGASARVQGSDLLRPRDVLSLTWQARYVEAYFRGWESIGAIDSKLVIPSQLVHALALTYSMKHGDGSVSGTLEVQNLTDEKVFDSFGVQQPGRAANAKLVLEL